MASIWSSALNWTSSRVPSAAERSTLDEALRAASGRGLDAALELLWTRAAGLVLVTSTGFASAFGTLPVDLYPRAEWRCLGFQHDDPTSDVRGAGALAVLVLARMFDAPGCKVSIGQRYAEKRRRDDEAAAAAHYPLATAAIVCTRSVLALLGVCVPVTGRELPYASTAKPHWHLVATETDLLDLSILLVRLVDDEFDHQKCTYMTFNSALKAAEARFALLLADHARDCADVGALAGRVEWKTSQVECWARESS